MLLFNQPPAGPDEADLHDIPDDRLALMLAAMVQDCQAARGALLQGDLTHALARTRLIQQGARLARFTELEDTAVGLEHAILAASEGRPNGTGLALEAVSRALERRLAAE